MPPLLPRVLGSTHYDFFNSDDEAPLRVVSETAFMKALGMYRSGALSVRREVSESGAQIPLSLSYKNLKPFILRHLGDVHYEPMKVLFHYRIIGFDICHPERLAVVSNAKNEEAPPRVIGKGREMLA